MARRLVPWFVGPMLCGCPAAHGDPADAGVVILPDASSCSTPRSVTLVVVLNTDGANGSAQYRAELPIDLINMLLTGDVDGARGAEFEPVSSVRLMMVSNEICGAPPYDGRWATEFPAGACEDFLRAPVLPIDSGADWEPEVLCRLLPGIGGDHRLCLGEPLEAALVALANDSDGVDVSPLSPLGGTVNRGWRETDDVVALVLEAPDYRDDCSHQFVPDGTPTCPAPGCCTDNLPPVTRTSEGLRQILRDRTYVVASLGSHPSFDPQHDEASRLDGWIRDGIPPLCGGDRPHNRMLALAREMQPDMHLVELSCDPLGFGTGNMQAFARDVFSRFCSP